MLIRYARVRKLFCLSTEIIYFSRVIPAASIHITKARNINDKRQLFGGKARVKKKRREITPTNVFFVGKTSMRKQPFLSFMWGNIISHSANSQTHMNEQEGILKLGPHWGSKGEAGKSRHYAADSVKWRGVEGKVFSQSVMRIKPLKQNLKPSSAAQHRTCCPLQQCTAIWRRRPLYRFIN